MSDQWQEDSLRRGEEEAKRRTWFATMKVEVDLNASTYCRQDQLDDQVEQIEAAIRNRLDGFPYATIVSVGVHEAPEWSDTEQ